MDSSTAPATLETAKYAYACTRASVHVCASLPVIPFFASSLGHIAFGLTQAPVRLPPFLRYQRGVDGRVFFPSVPRLALCLIPSFVLACLLVCFAAFLSLPPLSHHHHHTPWSFTSSLITVLFYFLVGFAVHLCSLAPPGE
ncbi:hypothetical protein LY78DRAFT_297135 [Colletotrichum sublineola]|nr:hypothetical protein LY78DRAFT_297135 [Colletotrichum sublineola]